MLKELEDNELKVVLIPSQDGDPHRKIRAVEARNPEWYSELCRMYPKERQSVRKNPRTYLWKTSIMNALKGLIKNYKTRSKYGEFLINIARKMKGENDELEEKKIEFVPFDDRF
jgi:hypothetical protein